MWTVNHYVEDEPCRKHYEYEVMDTSLTDICSRYAMINELASYDSSRS